MPYQQLPSGKALNHGKKSISFCNKPAEAPLQRCSRLAISHPSCSCLIVAKLWWLHNEREVFMKAFSLTNQGGEQIVGCTYRKLVHD